jgi:hypothetical protein
MSSTPRIRLPILLTAACLLSGCHRSPDGRKIFLQSEVALDKVRNFRMRLEGIGGRQVTDAEFVCDQDLAHWTTVNKPEDQKIEAVQTADTQFIRHLSPDPTPWHSQKQHDQAAPQPCIRLKHPAAETSLEDRSITVDQVSSLPPFFKYANDPGATITSLGTEVVNGIMCEVWYLKGGWHMPDHTVWIGVEDRLPRKYIEGNSASPDSVITYFDYNQPISIEVPSAESIQ